MSVRTTSPFWPAWAFALGLFAAVPDPITAANPRRSTTVEVVERVRGAVVNIHSERTVSSHHPDDPYNLNAGSNRVNGMGTGIVIDPRGYVVTNHHVIEDVSVIRVRLADGSTYPARVLARDPETDLALLKIDPRQALPVLPLGTASDLMIGEPVLAIGNAFGYEHTVTTGVVSATKRDVTLNKEISYKQLIQTDASINPGNSGGPLINMHGELVGVNVAIRAGAQGIGFAIPVDQMIRVAAKMLAGTRRVPVAAGMTLRDAVEPGSSPAKRLLVVERADPASGVKPGDVIVRAGGEAVCNSVEFERALMDRPAGEAVPIAVARDGAAAPVEVALQPKGRTVGGTLDLVWSKLGLKLQPIGPDAVGRVNGQLQGGLAVVELTPDGPAGRAGIQRGDILIGLHQWETVTVDNVMYVLNHPELQTFQPVRFFVIRGGQVRRGWLPQVP